MGLYKPGKTFTPQLVLYSSADEAVKPDNEQKLGLVLLGLLCLKLESLKNTIDKLVFALSLHTGIILLPLLVAHFAPNGSVVQKTSLIVASDCGEQELL